MDESKTFFQNKDYLILKFGSEFKITTLRSLLTLLIFTYQVFMFKFILLSFSSAQGARGHLGGSSMNCADSSVLGLEDETHWRIEMLLRSCGARDHPALQGLSFRLFKATPDESQEALLCWKLNLNSLCTTVSGPLLLSFKF